MCSSNICKVLQNKYSMFHDNWRKCDQIKMFTNLTDALSINIHTDVSFSNIQISFILYMCLILCFIFKNIRVCKN